LFFFFFAVVNGCFFAVVSNCFLQINDPLLLHNLAVFSVPIEYFLGARSVMTNDWGVHGEIVEMTASALMGDGQARQPVGEGKISIK
jgi:hypothetical protein